MGVRPPVRKSPCLRKTRRFIQKSIKDYFHYFPSGPVEEGWGHHVSAIGHTKIEPGTSYPPHTHPPGRDFSWERGRVLSALQLVALRSGAGEVEWTGEKRSVEANQAFLLPPGQWHRYRPCRLTGWTEDWLELRGPQVEQWLPFARAGERVFALPESIDFFGEMDALHDGVRERRGFSPGYLAGRAMALLAEVLDFPVGGGRWKMHPGRREIMARAREHLAAGASVGGTAATLGMSYPTLHRLFKAATGIAPKAYAEQLRMARAEAMLSDDHLTIKEIAAALGYRASNHFSAAFKRAYRRAPKDWRRRVLGFDVPSND